MGSCKNLLSPSDPAAKRENDKQSLEVDLEGKGGWGIRVVNYQGQRVNDSYIHQRAMSYAHCSAADGLHGNTIMILTRNVDGNVRDKNNASGYLRADMKLFFAGLQDYRNPMYKWCLALELNHPSSGKWCDPQTTH